MLINRFFHFFHFIIYFLIIIFFIFHLEYFTLELLFLEVFFKHFIQEIHKKYLQIALELLVPESVSISSSQFGFEHRGVVPIVELVELVDELLETLQILDVAALVEVVLGV